MTIASWNPGSAGRLGSDGGMRVLQVFEPPDGGVPEVVLRLALGLGAHGVEVEVAGPAKAMPYSALRAAGIPVHRIPFERAYRTPARDGRATRALAARIRSGRFDAVHTHSAKAGALGRVAARLAGVPAVHSPHCLPFEGDVSRRRHAFALATERRLGPLTAALICVCEHERRLALGHRLVPSERLWLVHYGTPAVPLSGPVDSRLEHFRGTGVLAGAVCVLRDQKGLHDLVEAAPAVLAAVPEARIAIVGNGPLAGSLDSHAATLGLDRDLRFARFDFVGPSAFHLRALDVFVLPSLWEALPIAVLEALACGVPQVATAVAGTPEAITAATGRLVPPRHPGTLAAALIEVLRDPALRSRLAAGSRERHRERFIDTRMAAATAAVYADVASAPQRPQPVPVEPALHV